MDKKEYLQRKAALEVKIDKLCEQRKDLDDEYTRECCPCQRGDIVEITFIDSTIKGITGMVCDSDFLYDGEFRPSLVKLKTDGITNQRIYYDGKAPISIKVLGKAPTCSQCLLRALSDGKMYCSIYYDDSGRMRVEPDRTMCSRGKYVEWVDNVPWAQSIIKNIINKKK